MLSKVWKYHCYNQFLMRNYSKFLAFQKFNLKFIPITHQKILWKKSKRITPAETASFISKCYGAAASNWYITETFGLLDRLNYGWQKVQHQSFAHVQKEQVSYTRIFTWKGKMFSEKWHYHIKHYQSKNLRWMCCSSNNKF